jgi:DNA-binding PadR family transcriptional regulator
LGLLSLGPASAYELVGEVKRSLNHFWPRAERKLYDEPKRLERLGLVTGREERTGKRVRTIYEITPAGREALAEWFRRPCAPSQFESEAVLKASLGDLTTKERMIEALRALRAESASALAEGRAIARSMLAEDHSDGSRAHVVAVMYEFVFSHFEMMARWAEWAEAEVESWPSTERSDDMERTLEVFRRALQRSEWVGSPSA